MTQATTQSGRRQVAYEAARLRAAGLRDIAELAALYRQSGRDYAETEASVQRWLERGGALVLEHAEAGGRIVCALRWYEADGGWRLDRIATLPEFRGQNFGRWLMTKVEALAIQRNIPWLTLELEAGQDDLLAYYGRMGYRESEAGSGVLQKRVGGVWQQKDAGGRGPGVDSSNP